MPASSANPLTSRPDPLPAQDSDEFADLHRKGVAQLMAEAQAKKGRKQ
ncbi:MAG TPA: hypothetical protein VM240_05525 [Verrucomicrobiae bacterium]|nr:hypothetical protein [Verrucomicrobiae bacterium]